MSYKSSEEATCTQTQQYSKCTAITVGICCFLLILGVMVGLPVSIVMSVPPETKFSIVEASIVQFNLTSNNTLHYNFEFTITAKNLDKNEEIYDRVIAIASYKGNQLTSVNIASFMLNGKNIIRLEPIVFEGNSGMIFNPQQLVKYNNERDLRIYNLDLDIYSSRPIPDVHIHCPNLRVPLISNGKIAPTFNVTTCSHKDAY